MNVSGLLATLGIPLGADTGAPLVFRAANSTSKAAPGALQLGQTVEQINDALRTADEHLQFSVHQETHAIVVKLMDASTKEVLREFPSEKFLDLVAKLQELAGLQVDVKL